MTTIDVGCWADTFMAQYVDREVIGSALFVLSRSAEESEDIDVDFVPLDGHPADCLRGYRVAASCVGLGLITAGWSAPIDSTVRPSAHPDAKRIVQVAVVARTGATAARIRMPDGSIVDPGSGGYGRVLDALRAPFGLPPTMPPGGGLRGPLAGNRAARRSSARRR